MKKSSAYHYYTLQQTSSKKFMPWPYSKANYQNNSSTKPLTILRRAAVMINTVWESLNSLTKITSFWLAGPGPWISCCWCGSYVASCEYAQTQCASPDVHGAETSSCTCHIQTASPLCASACVFATPLQKRSPCCKWNMHAVVQNCEPASGISSLSH